MIVFQTRVGIERPIEEVFAYVSDPGNFPVLERGRPGRTPDVRGSEQRRLDLRDQRQLPSGAATNQLEIAKGEQPHEFAIGTTAGPTPFLYRYTFGPAWVLAAGPVTTVYFCVHGAAEALRFACSRVAATKQEPAMALGDEVDEIFRREVKSLPAYAKAQAAGGSGIAPPVDEMNQLLMGLVIATQRSFHLLAKRIEELQDA